MATSFELKFSYDIKYKPSDILYFGVNLLLGNREFPLRFASSAGGGPDMSPVSSGTFEFAGPSRQLLINSSNIIDFDGINEVTNEILYSSNSLNKISFKTGSVALRQVVEFNPKGSLNDFFSTQFTELTNISLVVTTDTNTTLLKGPPLVKFGKQYGEILLLSWESVS
jgi:hypothetical protein